MNPDKRAFVYAILAIMGILLIIYTIKIKNYILAVAAILFVYVSADNTFCGYGKNTEKKKSDNMQNRRNVKIRFKK